MNSVEEGLDWDELEREMRMLKICERVGIRMMKDVDEGVGDDMIGVGVCGRAVRVVNGQGGVVRNWIYLT